MNRNRIKIQINLDFLVPYSAAVYKGLSSLFSTVFPGVETWVWILIIACLTAIYLVAGGYVATAYTDLIQGIVMIVGVVCLVAAVLGHENVGGFSGLIANLGSFQSLPGDPSPTTGAQLTNIFGGSSFKFLIPSVRKKNTKPETQMLLTRLLCLVFVACSFIFATQNIPIIVSLMSFSWGVVSGCFIGPYIWGLFSKKITKTGAFVGMLAGLLTVGISTLVITLNSGFAAAAAKSPEMGVSAMAVSIIVVPLVSAFTKVKDKNRVDEIFECYKEN